MASRRGRIETLLMQKQIDAERVKLGQESHKVFQAAAQAVDVPGLHDVELALGGVPTQSIERRPSIVPPRGRNSHPPRDASTMPINCSINCSIGLCRVQPTT